MTRRSNPTAVAVLAVGRSQVQLLAVAPHGQLLSVRSAPNEVRAGDPYPSCDTGHIWRWMMAALADLGERFTIEAIVPTSYGPAAALVDQADLVLPILDYEADPPAPIAAAYAAIAPWFEECHCPIDPAGLTLGRQLFWLSRAFPGEFERARWILPFAQYWAWGLAGVPACEVTSLGAQTQLWSPGRGSSHRWCVARAGRRSCRRCAAPGTLSGRSSTRWHRSARCRSISRCCAEFMTAAPTSRAIWPPASATSHWFRPVPG
jgi:sugar (pentulose or hexulose) kinase